MNRIFLLLGTLLPLAPNAQNAPDPLRSPKPDYPNSHQMAPQQQDLLGKGTWHLGLNAAGDWGGFPGFRGLVAPRIFYFVKDSWAINLDAKYEATDNFYTRASLGLSTRYYFVRDRRLALFGQTGASVGLSTAKWSSVGYVDGSNFRLQPIEQSGITYQVQVGLGMSYRVSNRGAGKPNLHDVSRFHSVCGYVSIRLAG